MAQLTHTWGPSRSPAARESARLLTCAQVLSGPPVCLLPGASASATHLYTHTSVMGTHAHVGTHVRRLTGDQEAAPWPPGRWAHSLAWSSLLGLWEVMTFSYLPPVKTPGQREGAGIALVKIPKDEAVHLPWTFYLVHLLPN